MKSSFCAYIKERFEEKVKQNPRLSLRGYARQLGVDPSVLSRFLKQERTISESTFKKVASKLCLSPEEYSFYSNNILKGNNSAIRIQEREIDEFKLISEWYNLAILELLDTKFRLEDSKMYAKRLGVSEIEIENALERLIRLGYLIQTEDGYEKSNQSNNFVTIDKTGSTNSAKKTLQKQLLQFAIDAVDEIEVTKRSNSSLTLAINKKDIPLVKSKINEFRDSLHSVSRAEPDDNDSVYQLAIAFYPLLKERTK